MKTSSFRLKLFLVLLAFAIVVTFTIIIVDYFRLNQQAVTDSENQMEQATEMVLYALKTVDKAYLHLDEETATKMEQNTYELQDLYEENPHFETWDFKELSESIKMDIYILDQNNRVIHSNVNEEIGLDFSVCCKSFHEILTERRESGELFIDGIDIDQKTGDGKKFSYMATADKEYIIELGYSLENDELFKEFNFLTIADEVVEDFSLIEEMNVLNFGGIPFGSSEGANLPNKHREAFEQARNENKIVEIESTYENQSAIYRYVPYLSAYDHTDNTKMKVIEVVYNQDQVDYLLQSNKNTLLIQLIVVLIVTIFVSSLIASWFAKPVYLAFHDSLTGLKNRAAFDEDIESQLKETNGDLALFMMDLDNFKLVNDYLGHDKGDYLLKQIAMSIKKAAGNEYEAFRLGGDEFAILVPYPNDREIEALAESIVDTIQADIADEREIKMLAISVSIGIAISDRTETPEELYKKADIALYASKEKGKNQYQIYTHHIAPNIPVFHS